MKNLMKTLFAVTLMMCMLMGCAFAQTAVTEINWSDVEALAAGIEGEFCLVGDTGLMMYIPADMTERELTDESVSNGFFLLMSNEDNTFFLAGSVYDGTLDQFKEQLVPLNAQVEDGILNGIACTSYDYVDENGNREAGVAFPTESGDQVIVLSVSPVTEQTTIRAAVMTASIQAAQ